VSYLLDTSILARLANVADVQHAVAAGAVLEPGRLLTVVREAVPAEPRGADPVVAALTGK